MAAAACSGVWGVAPGWKPPAGSGVSIYGILGEIRTDYGQHDHGDVDIGIRGTQVHAQIGCQAVESRFGGAVSRAIAGKWNPPERRRDVD